MFSLRYLTSVSLLALAAAKSPFSPSLWPLPHNVTGDTSTWGGKYVHDPSVVLGPDGHFYSFTTHNLVGIGRSSEAYSLDGYWDIIGSVLVNASIIDLPGNNDTWAPDVHKVGDTYYCYYAVSSFGSQDSAIGLATSKTLLPGSWTDHGEVLRSSASATIAPYPRDITNAIDPNLFIDVANGSQPLLNYGSFWGDIWQFHLGPELKHVKDTPAPVQLSYDPTPPAAEEGAYMSKYGEWYYLWFSHGQCCGFNASDLPAAGLEYSIRVGRSKSAQGPFVDRNGTDLVNGGGYIVYGSHDYVYAPGGQGVLSDYDGRDVLYYHYFNIISNPTYEDAETTLGWDYIEYLDGWPILVYDIAAYE